MGGQIGGNIYQVFRKFTSIQNHLARGEEHKDVLQAKLDGLQPSDQQADDVEARDV